MNSDPTVSIDLLKPAEVAARLGVSRTWLYDAAKEGRIPSIRIGGSGGPLRFVPADLERWIDEARAEIHARTSSGLDAGPFCSTDIASRCSSALRKRGESQPFVATQRSRWRE